MSKKTKELIEFMIKKQEAQIRKIIKEELSKININIDRANVSLPETDFQE